ncbi:hypothetical protein DW083_05165 [Parabacteroides sp. AF48-14]|nr:hypothetical protein DW083_05165 [Parabacteroides sp. AF48-14]
MINLNSRRIEYLKIKRTASQISQGNSGAFFALKTVLFPITTVQIAITTVLIFARCRVHYILARVMAKRTVVIWENTQKRGKSPFLRSKKRINICFVSDVFRAGKIRFIQ